MLTSLERVRGCYRKWWSSAAPPCGAWTQWACPRSWWWRHPPAGRTSALNSRASPASAQNWTSEQKKGQLFLAVLGVSNGACTCRQYFGKSRNFSPNYSLQPAGQGSCLSFPGSLMAWCQLFCTLFLERFIWWNARIRHQGQQTKCIYLLSWSPHLGLV